MIIIIFLTLFASLAEDVDGFMDDYSYSGYTFQYIKSLYLEANQPQTFRIYLNSNLEGVLCGIGGNTILDLYLELDGGGKNITDIYVDDLPVLQFSTEAGSLDYVVTVSANDFLYGSTADSAYVFVAMRPVVNEINEFVPEEPDSIVIGE